MAGEVSVMEEKDTKVIWAENITYRAKEKKIKLMDLAEKVGVAGSFFSRARKGDSRADAEVLMKIADELGVSLDVLMKCDMTALGKNEQLILDTIYKVTQETLAEKVEWKQVTKEERRQVDHQERPVFPFSKLWEENGSKYIKFESLFDTDEHVASIEGNVYSVSLSNAVRMYLIPVRVENRVTDGIGLSCTYEDGIELCLATSDGRKTPVCCSYNGLREEIVLKLTELYEIVKKRDEQDILEPLATELLSGYLDDKLPNYFETNDIETDELPF